MGINDRTGPVELTDAQMDTVAAGGVFEPFNFAPFYASSPLPIDPALVNYYYGLYAPSIAFGFSSAPTVYDGLNNLNALVSSVAGVPFVPIWRTASNPTTVAGMAILRSAPDGGRRRPFFMGPDLLSPHRHPDEPARRVLLAPRLQKSPGPLGSGPLHRKD